MLSYEERMRITEEEKFRLYLRCRIEKDQKGRKSLLRFIIFFLLGFIFPPIFVASAIAFFKTMISFKHFLIALLILIVPGTLLFNILKIILSLLIGGNE